ncbi:sensor histidine kinase [Cupriavidus sp. D39]|uniref:sensor histidine kinase n=1 Tax=Cupriavidus sp. D39 TaxID=2997877 RepID=UPI003B63E3A9
MNHTLPTSFSSLVESFEIDAANLEARKALLDFTPQDGVLLGRLNAVLPDLDKKFLDAFYAQLGRLEDRPDFLDDANEVENAKQRQTRTFRRLTGGAYDLAFAQSCLLAGVRRHGLGLKPAWYIGAYARYFETLVPQILSSCDKDPEASVATTLALIKAVLLDLGLVIDAYFHADHEILRLFAKVFESDMEGVVIATTDQRIVHANGMAARLLGRERETLAGVPLNNLPVDCAAFEAAWDAALATGAWRGEMMMQAGERRFPAEVGIGGVKDEQGRVTHYVFEFSDVTERQRALAELAGRTEELARSNKELEQFAYVASHDLQEPLRMVASYTQLLARRYKGKLDDDADEFIHYAVDGATRMQALINDLLAYSRVGTRVRSMTSVASGVALEKALENLQVSIEQSGAVITHDPLPEVTGDLTQITLLFQNLVGNAIKYRGTEPPLIHVSAVPEGAAWVFSVRDNGIGFAAEFADRIFQIFQRLHTKEEYPGTGIGLAIAKKIVERHGGRIWVESEAGQGATFYFSMKG